jgi:hypothetical protein
MISENTGFYLYSSLLQAKAALFSLFGLYVTFRIQSISSDIQYIKEVLVRTNSANYIIVFDQLSLVEKKNKIISKENSDISYKDIKYKSWVNKLIQRSQIRKNIIPTLIMLAVSMTFDSVLIILDSFLSNTWYQGTVFLFEVLSFILILVMLIHSTYLIIRTDE